MTHNSAQVRATKQRIASETPFAIRVFRAIYGHQKPDEKRLRQHIGHDGLGFQEIETPRMCRLYERLERRGWKLTAEEADMLRLVMQKYARQYLEGNAQATERKRRELADEQPVGKAAGGARRRSRYSKVGSGPSPERGEDDDLRGLFEGMSLEQRGVAINRMADRLGV